MSAAWGAKRPCLSLHVISCASCQHSREAKGCDVHYALLRLLMTMLTVLYCAC